MSLIIKLPQGPIRPIVEALEENEILHGWVNQLEDSAAHQLKRLQEEGAEILQEGDDYYSIYHGLDGTTWALDSLFSDYYPGLQRAAAFLVIWGSLERHIDELCREIMVAALYEIQVGDLTGHGLTRARSYLLKVAALDGKWAHVGWQEFPDLQRLRNLFAHGDGHLEPRQTKLASYVKGSAHLGIREGVVTLKATFLPHVLRTERAFLDGLEEVVVERFGHGA